jgi:hypothetical protein
MKQYRYLFLVAALLLVALATPTLAAAAPAHNLATYTHPDGLWRIQYPAEVLHVEKLNENVTIFISKDRHTVAAVDTFEAPGNAYGNSGEGLRNRARDVLAQIYGAPVKQTGGYSEPPAPWETGIAFKTTKGSMGVAVYEQRGRDSGDTWVHGFLYGYKTVNRGAMLPVMKAMRASFEIGPFAPQGSDEAREALGAYFGALYAGDYAEAVARYGGSYEVLVGWNPDVAPYAQARLFQRGCEQNGLECMRLKRIVEERTISAGEFQFVVEFLNDDGTLFKLGPVGGETSGPTYTQFTYTVRNVGGEYLVQDLPVYMP